MGPLDYSQPGGTAGLVDVQAEGFVAVQLGGTPSARLWLLTLEQMQDDMLAAGLLTRAELEDYRRLLESPEYRGLLPMAISVWGRRVSDDTAGEPA